ncbi:MAG: methyltransferase, partial [Candidatus Micrarchaeaceae archaeon]
MAATDFLNFIKSKYNLTGASAADLGCGNGILGIALLLSGAHKVDFYDIDKKALDICTKNLESNGLRGYSIFEKDIFDIKDKVYDIVVSNPPFGIQSDLDLSSLLNKVKELSDNVFLILKKNKGTERLAKEQGFIIGPQIKIRIGVTARFHKKPSVSVDSYIVYKLAESENKYGYASG